MFLSMLTDERISLWAYNLGPNSERLLLLDVSCRVAMIFVKFQRIGGYDVTRKFSVIFLLIGIGVEQLNPIERTVGFCTKLD